jgi:aryl-alcohol dehydrogenase-like predicted oxidoreductase
MSGGATREGTARYAERFRGIAAEGHFRQVAGITMSSLGIGTYLGPPNDSTDSSYTAAIVAAVESGINLVDTAINYRLQRSERSVGTALKVLARKGISRDEIVVCTKGGYLTPDGSIPSDPNRYFFEEYVQKGVLSAKDIAAGCHCLTARFLENQLNRSLKNLQLDAIDVYYLHNPETQLAEISSADFLLRIREAFVWLESAVSRGQIQFYGLATWNGFRQEKAVRDAMQLGDIAAIAKQVAGEKHGFRFVQLPFNLAMTEALTLGNQLVPSGLRTMMEAANELGIHLIASASLLQGQVAQNLPSFVADALGLHDDAERALQFARSAPGISAALVGMSRSAHVQANARLVETPSAGLDQFSRLFSPP